MERVSILEASRRLNLSQAVIRQHIREGRLKAERGEGNGPSGGGWLVELPEEGWEDSEKESFIRMARELSPWWWPNGEKTGEVHYVEDVGIEEIEPKFLCGLESDNIWPGDRHSESDRCVECLRLALDQGLPLDSSQ